MSKSGHMHISIKHVKIRTDSQVMQAENTIMFHVNLWLNRLKIKGGLHITDFGMKQVLVSYIFGLKLESISQDLNFEAKSGEKLCINTCKSIKPFYDFKLHLAYFSNWAMGIPWDCEPGGGRDGREFSALFS